LSQLVSRASDFFVSDGKWGDVRSGLGSAANGIFSSFQRQYEPVVRSDGSCGNLSREDRNPVIEQAMLKVLEGKKGIETLYAQLDRQLGELAGLLKGLEGRSSSDVDNAESKAGEIARSVDQLDQVRGQDSEAKRRVDVYRELLSTLRE